MQTLDPPDPQLVLQESRLHKGLCMKDLPVRKSSPGTLLSHMTQANSEQLKKREMCFSLKSSPALVPTLPSGPAQNHAAETSWQGRGHSDVQ